ncbi:MAG: DUF4198 domain-containing protein [Sphingobacteriia bacterium]|jgi:uncharacterized GH25 family protein
MKKYASISLIIFIVFSTLLNAHEFWIAPSKYIVKSNERFSFNCYVGEDFTPAIWAKRSQRTLKVMQHHLNNSLDITPIFINNDSLNILMGLKGSGNFLIALSSKPSYIEMEGKAFNDYLKEDGMMNVLEYRNDNKIDQQRSREYYQRCAKTLLQVAGKNDDSYKKNTGMPLEIIPQSNPYTINNDSLSVFFEFKGKPLSNYQVRTWCKKNGQLIVKSFHTTNEKGVAVLSFKESGEWMISLVKMEILNNNEKADYESYWGSYTFYKN